MLKVADLHTKEGCIKEGGATTPNYTEGARTTTENKQWD